VDPVPDLLLVRKSGSAGNRTWTSGSVARNYDHLTTEAVGFTAVAQSINCVTSSHAHTICLFLRTLNPYKTSSSRHYLMSNMSTGCSFPEHLHRVSLSTWSHARDTLKMASFTEYLDCDSWILLS
jgi:hypothetical protein